MWFTVYSTTQELTNVGKCDKYNGVIKTMEDLSSFLLLWVQKEMLVFPSHTLTSIHNYP